MTWHDVIIHCKFLIFNFRGPFCKPLFSEKVSSLKIVIIIIIQSKTSIWSAVNFKKYVTLMSSKLELRYGHVILVSRDLVSTGVNWPWHGCKMSKKDAINQGCMSLSTYSISWSMAAILRHLSISPAAVIVVVHTRPWAIMPGTITMGKLGRWSSAITYCFTLFHFCNKS